MNKLFMILAILLSLSIAVPALSHADSNKYISLEELEGLSTTARNEIIKKRLKDLGASKGILGDVSNLDPRSIEAWSKAISTGIKTVCIDLSISVNEFVKTDAGKITMFLIIYQVLGDDIRRIIFGMLIWLVTMPIIATSFIHFHTSRKIKVLGDKGQPDGIKYVKRYTWESSDSRTVSAVVHAAFFVAVTILCAVALLG